MKSRDPPLKKRRITPSDDPEILVEWKHRFDSLRKERIGKCACYQIIAEEYKTTRSTVWRWLNEKSYLEHKESQKNRCPKTNIGTHDYRLRTATRLGVYRHIDDFVSQAFSGESEELSAEEITLRIYNNLVQAGRPGILLKLKTLLNLVEQYETKNNRRLLTEVEDTDPVVYKFHSPL